MDAICGLLFLCCIIATVILHYFKKWLFRLSIRLGDQASKRLKRLRMGKH